MDTSIIRAEKISNGRTTQLKTVEFNNESTALHLTCESIDRSIVQMDNRKKGVTTPLLRLLDIINCDTHRVIIVLP